MDVLNYFNAFNLITLGYSALFLVIIFYCLNHSSYTTSVGAKHFHTSAKTNKGIEDMFLELCKSKYLLTLNTTISKHLVTLHC